MLGLEEEEEEEEEEDNAAFLAAAASSIEATHSTTALPSLPLLPYPGEPTVVPTVFSLKPVNMWRFVRVSTTKADWVSNPEILRTLYFFPWCHSVLPMTPLTISISIADRLYTSASIRNPGWISVFDLSFGVKYHPDINSEVELELLLLGSPESVLPELVAAKDMSASWKCEVVV